MITYFKKVFLKLVVFSSVILLSTAPLVWLQLSHPQQLQSITSIFSHHPTLMIVFRWLLIALFIGGWPYFIRKYAKKHVWQAEKTQFWLAQRLRISTWLVIFELLICENLLLILIKLL